MFRSDTDVGLWADPSTMGTSLSGAIDLPVSNPVTEEEGSSGSRCSFCDVESVAHVAQLLLQGLVIACVGSTKGDLFQGPASVADIMRSEMVNYLTHKGKEYVSNCHIQAHFYEPESAEYPIKIISSLINEFANSKRNLLSRVSGWISGDARDSGIFTIVQEMEMNGFWPMHKREAVAETLVRYVDFGKEWHCQLSFDNPDQLLEHKSECIFRPLHCKNEGCTSTFSANQLEKHDAQCHFKMLPCQQKCPQEIARHEMDMHCNTVCPMKLVNCPFLLAGCHSNIPQGAMEQHFSGFLHSHLLNILQIIRRQEETTEELKQRMDLLEKSQSLNERSESVEVRSLKLAIKEQEAKVKKLENSLSKMSKGRG